MNPKPSTEAEKAGNGSIQGTDPETFAEKIAESAESRDSAPAAPSPIEPLKAELQAEKNKYLYLYAEFENYKKRALRERADLIKYGNESLIRELLQVTDNLSRALEHAREKPADGIQALMEGIELVRRQFLDTLARFGVEAIESVGRKFDPERHEAVAQQPVDKANVGEVLVEHQKGYLFQGRLLRPAKVVVGTAKGDPPPLPA